MKILSIIISFFLIIFSISYSYAEQLYYLDFVNPAGSQYIYNISAGYDDICMYSPKMPAGAHDLYPGKSYWNLTLTDNNNSDKGCSGGHKNISWVIEAKTNNTQMTTVGSCTLQFYHYQDSGHWKTGMMQRAGDCGSIIASAICDTENNQKVNCYNNYVQSVDNQRITVTFR